jgi:hypothetical protein
LIDLTERPAARRARLRALSLPLLLSAVIAVSFGSVARAEEPETDPYPDPKLNLLPGSREFFASSYQPAARNVALLKELKAGMGARRVVLAPNKKQIGWLMCRGSFPVYAPGQVTYASWVRTAINAELEQAGLFAPDAPKVQVWLDRFDFSSAMFGNAQWMIDLSMADEAKPPISVTSVYEFEGTVRGEEACRNVTFQLQTALEGALFKLYSTPGFSEMFR